MPSSFQNAAPGAKSVKFADAMDPFAGFLGREQAEIEDSTAVLSKQLDTRLRVSQPYDMPTAATPQQPQEHMMQQQVLQQQAVSVANKKMENPSSNNKKQNKEHAESDSDDSDLEEFDDNDDDAILEAIRQKRLKQLESAQQKADQYKAKGHGQVRIISQEEFLPECTSSKYVVVHFFHKEFERCKILSFHLKKLAPSHLSCKFVEIDAEKAPFFVVKLKVQTLPTLIVFKDGKAVNRLVGFEDLMTASDNNQTINEFPTSRLGYWLEQTGAIEYEGPNSDEEDPTTKSRTSGSHRYATYDKYDE